MTWAQPATELGTQPCSATEGGEGISPMVFLACFSYFLSMHADPNLHRVCSRFFSFNFSL